MPTLSDLSREMPDEYLVANFLSIVDSEPSDRSAAIIAASFVEQALYTAVTSRMADCGEGVRNTWFQDSNAPFGTFSAKIKLGRALGVYGEQMEKRLERIKNIRNVFAHRTGAIDFSHPTIMGEVRKMAPKPVTNDKIRARYCAACAAQAKLLIDAAFKYGGREMEISYP